MSLLPKDTARIAKIRANECGCFGFSLVGPFPSCFGTYLYFIQKNDLRVVIWFAFRLLEIFFLALCMNSLVCIPLFSNWYVNACLYQPMVSGLPISFGNLSLDLHNYAKLILSTAPSPAHCAFIFSKNSNFHGMKLFELIAWGHSALGCVIHWEGRGKGRLLASITSTWSWRWWKGSLLARSLLQAQGPDLGWGRACQGEHAGGKKNLFGSQLV